MAFTAVSMVPWPEIITTNGRSDAGNLLNPAQRFEAVDSRQPDVEQHDLVDGGSQRIETLFAALHRLA